MSLKDVFDELSEKAQGFYGHAGRPGKRGGSLPKGGGGVFEKVVTGLETVRTGFNKAVIEHEVSGKDVKLLEKGLKSSGFNKTSKEKPDGKTTLKTWKKGSQNVIIHRSDGQAYWSVSVSDQSNMG